MMEYLKKDGRKWHIAELELKNIPIVFEYGNDYMATTLENIPSKEGFKPINEFNKQEVMKFYNWAIRKKMS
jgi:hypothetical protein